MKFGEVYIESLGPHSTLLKENRDKNVVIVGTEDTDIELVTHVTIKNII